MKKSSKIVDKMNPNKQVEVTITNKKVIEEDETLAFQPTVTIKITLPKSGDQFKLSTDEDIAKFVETIDFEDPQEELPLDES